MDMVKINPTVELYFENCTFTSTWFVGSEIETLTFRLSVCILIFVLK